MSSRRSSRKSKHFNAKSGDKAINFIIDDCIGRGATATVYNAKKLDILSPVGDDRFALKVYKSGDSAKTHFENEQKIYSYIMSNDNDGVEETDGIEYIIPLLGFTSIIHFGADWTSYIHPVSIFPLAGEDLYTVMDLISDGFPVDTVQQIMREIITGIKYLHARGIIHTDIKPENIYLTKSINDICGNDDIHIKIGDFGTATTTEEYFRKSPGSIEYCSPELTLGWVYEKETDIWALGCLCFELIAGKSLFKYDAKESRSSSEESDPECDKWRWSKLKHSGRESDSESDSGYYSSNSASDSESDTDDDYLVRFTMLRQMITALGPFPKKIAHAAGYYLNCKGYCRYTAGNEKISVFSRLVEAGVIDAEAEVAAEFIEYCLRYIPDERPSAADLLKSTFMNYKFPIEN